MNIEISTAQMPYVKPAAYQQVRVPILFPGNLRWLLAYNVGDSNPSDLCLQVKRSSHYRL